MVNTLRRACYWPQIASAVYITITNCERFVQNGSRIRHKSPLQLFLAFVSLDLPAIDNLGPLPNTKQSNRYTCAVTDQCSELVRGITMSKTSYSHMEHIFVDHRIISFGIPNYLIMENGPQFVSKSFTLDCRYLDVKHLAMTAYYLQTSGQARQFNQTITAHLRHYVAKHQRD